MINVAKIRTDGGTQIRAELNPLTVAEYAEAMASGETAFPPVTVFYDGTDHWLADGFHRVAAAREAGIAEIEAQIIPGSRRDAILHACGANAAHGLRRTNEDKRRAVERVLRDDEWRQWSDREIARRCAVSHIFVAKVRAEMRPDGGNAAAQHTGNVSSEAPNPLKTNNQESRKYTDRHGNQTVMRVGAIGKNAGGGAESAHAAASEAPDAGGEENSPEPAPVVSAAERKWQAMDDAERKRAWIKMADDLAVARARIRDLEGRLKVFEADGDIGKTLGMALRNLAVVEGRAKEHQANAARLQRRVNAQAKEIAALKKQLAAQEFEL